MQGHYKLYRRGQLGDWLVEKAFSLYLETYLPQVDTACIAPDPWSFSAIW